MNTVEKGGQRKVEKMETLHIKLKGLSPLLMNNPISMARAEGGALSRKVIPAPEEEAAAKRYLLPDGNFYLPAIAVRASMLNGARGYRIGRRPAREILAAAVILTDEVFPISRDGKPIPGSDYQIEIRRAVVQRQGVMRARPRIDLPWELECIFNFNSELANLEQVTTALQTAGQAVGLLDYRPEKSGWFGRFEVTNIWSE